MAEKFSPADIQDLLQIHQMLPSGDPRKAKVASLLQQTGNMGAAPSAPFPPLGTMPGTEDPTDPRARLGQWAAQEGVGALKGGLSTLYHTGELATKYLDPQKYAEIQARQQANPAQAAVTQGLITPDAGQKLGFYGEQAGEFMLPEMALGKAADAIKGAQALGKYGPAAARLARVGGEGPLSGGVNALQGKDFTSGAEMGMGSEVGGQIIGGALRSIGEPILNSALNISGSKLRRTNPAQFMFENGGFGIHARSANAMREFADEQAKNVYQQIADVTENSGATINLQPMRDKGNQRLAQFMGQQNPNLVAQGNAVMDTANNVTLPIMGVPMTVPRNAQVPMTAAMDVKRGLGAARSWNGNNFFEPPVTSMRDAMYGTLNEAMNTAHPELRGLNNAYSNLATIGDSIERKSSMWPSLMAGGFGAVAGAHAGGVPGFLTAVGTGALYHGITSAPGGYALGRLGAAVPTLFNFAKDAALGSQSGDNQGTNPF